MNEYIIRFRYGTSIHDYRYGTMRVAAKSLLEASELGTNAAHRRNCTLVGVTQKDA